MGYIASDGNLQWTTVVKKAGIDKEAAERVAVSALSFVASDPELLPRFLAITGIDASRIRAAAEEPGFLAGVLEFILAHEPTLDAFAAYADIDPADVGAAHQALSEAGYDSSI